MIGNFLLLVGILIVGIGYLRLLVLKLQSDSKVKFDFTGFDLAKEITANYDEINIVESKEVLWSQYHLKRGVIRLTPKNYGAMDIFSLAISACLSGISLANIHRDKYVVFFSKIFSSMGCISKSSIIAILIALFTGSIGDAKIGLVLLSILLVYQYILIQIQTVGCYYSQEALKEIDLGRDKVEVFKIQRAILSTYTLAFVAILIFLLREVMIILNF